MTYTFTIEVPRNFAAVLEEVREALRATGFGVISDIDLKATLSEKLGAAAAAELGDYQILGACNPTLAREALRADPSVGALLPCNVVVRRTPGASSTTVEAIDPKVISDVSADAGMAAVAADAAARLQAALRLIYVPNRQAENSASQQDSRSGSPR